MKKILFILTILLSLNSEKLLSQEFKIVLKVNNEIITNFDIEKEKKYLIALNSSLKNIEDAQIYNLARKSIIREKIKNIELSKFYNLEINENQDILKNIVNNLFIKNGLTDEKQIRNYLKEINLEYDWVLQKIKIETYWNNLIMQKYINQVKIDNKEISKELKNQLKNLKKKRQLLLSEILIQIDNQKNPEEYKEKILKNINEIGFENTASIYSISESSKTGGLIGWIDEKTLTKQIFDSVKNLKKNEITSFIKLNNNYLVLKILDVKEIEQNYDFEKILEKRITLKKNQQLEIFSGIYFEKIKQSMIIDEK